MAEIRIVLVSNEFAIINKSALQSLCIPQLKNMFVFFSRLNFSYNLTENQINKTRSGRCGYIDDLVLYIVKNKN